MGFIFLIFFLFLLIGLDSLVILGCYKTCFMFSLVCGSPKHSKTPKMADLSNFERLHGNQLTFRGKFENAYL